MSFTRKESLSNITKLVVSSCLILIPVFSSFVGWSIDGVIPLIQQYYDIKDAETATIQTASSIANTASLALIWIFGEMFSRRRLFLFLTSCWIILTLISFILGSRSFMMYVIFRALAGAASSVLGILEPVILADIFRDRELGIALMISSVLNIANTMLADIVSSWIVTSSVPWQAGMLTATVLCIAPLLVLLCLKGNIPSGKLNEEDNQGISRIVSSATSMFKIKSYILLAAEASLGLVQGKAYVFWFPSIYLLAWTNVPEVFFGLSYTTITALNSAVNLAGTLVGMPIILWFAQSWRHGTGPFSGRKGYIRAYPIVTGMAAVFNIITFVLGVLLMDKSYPAALVNNFLVGFWRSAGGTVGQLVMFAITPSSSRAAAMALERLIAGFVSIPSAQIFGFISDSIRGDSMMPEDRFHAYQLVLLSTSLFMALGVLCHIIMIVFFPKDCDKAQQKEMEEQGVVDENTPLSGKARAESIVESFVRSRSSTVNLKIFNYT